MCWVMSQTDEMWVIVPTGLTAPRSVQQCVMSAMAHLILTAEPGESRKRVSLELKLVKRESKLIHMYISCQLVCSPEKSVGKRQYFLKSIRAGGGGETGSLEVTQTALNL